MCIWSTRVWFFLNFRILRCVDASGAVVSYIVDWRQDTSSILVIVLNQTQEYALPSRGRILQEGADEMIESI